MKCDNCGEYISLEEGRYSIEFDDSGNELYICSYCSCADEYDFFLDTYLEVKKW